MSEPIQLHKWEKISEHYVLGSSENKINCYTYRMKVPGGWIYKEISPRFERDILLIFVPDPPKYNVVAEKI